MSIYASVKALSDKAGITIAALERELCFGNGTIRGWDKNMPSVTKVQQVAQYFGITTSELLGENEQKESAIFADDAFSSEEFWLINMWRKATLDDKDIVRMLLRKYDATAKKEIV